MNSKLDESKAAIFALPDPTQTVQASAWLVDFEKSSVAWEVADALMRESAGSQLRFFGAKFFHAKIQRDFRQLDSGSIPSLVRTLVDHIIRLSQEPLPDITVCRYLCLSVAALAVQMSHEGIVNQILLWLNPILVSNPQIILELLTVLPEECFNRHVDVSHELRENFAEQLTHSVPEVFGFLTSLCCAGHTCTDDVACKSLKCLERWIDYTNIIPGVLVKHQMFNFAVESLKNDLRFESAVDILIVTLLKYRCREQDITSTVLPVVMALRPTWAHLVDRLNRDSSDEELCACRSLCRLFTEAAEAYLDIIVGDSAPQLDDLVNQLVHCASFAHDYTIARIPLKFFYELSIKLHDVDRQDQHSQCSNPSRFKQTFLSLFGVTLERVRLQPGTVSVKNQIEEDEKEMRAEYKDVIADCCSVAGWNDCLQRACAVLQNELILQQGIDATKNPTSDIHWTSIEGALFCISAFASSVDRSENVMVPQLMQFICALPDLPILQITATSLVGSFSHWICCNGALLNTLLTQLANGLRSPVKCLTSARTISELFRACSGIHALPIHELHTLMLEMRNSQTLPIESDLLLLEGLTEAISRLSEDQRLVSLKVVIEPVAQSLLRTLGTVPVIAKSVAGDIDRLTVTFRYTSIDGAGLATLFSSVQPLLAQVLSSSISSDYIAEKVCRFYKHAMRSCRSSFVPLLNAMMRHLSEEFNRRPSAAFLYAASICVSDYYKEDGGSHIAAIYDMLWKMSSKFFAEMSSLQQFEQRPDVVEEYFYLMARALQYCPSHMLESLEEARTVIHAGVTGLQLKHSDAQKGILLFFERLVLLLGSERDHRHREVVQSLVILSAPSLVSTIFFMLVGVIPANALDENHGCIGDVLWSLRTQLFELFQTCFDDVVSKMSSPVQTIVLKTELRKVLLGAGLKNEFIRILDQFRWRCLRC